MRILALEEDWIHHVPYDVFKYDFYFYFDNYHDLRERFQESHEDSEKKRKNAMKNDK